jgi:hypothetical protein
LHGARCCVSAAILAQDVELPRADEIFRKIFIALVSLSDFFLFVFLRAADYGPEIALAWFKTASRKYV